MKPADGSDCAKVSAWLKSWGVGHDQVTFDLLRGPTGAFVAQAYVAGYWREVGAIAAEHCNGDQLKARMVALCDECGAMPGFDGAALSLEYLSPQRGFVIGRITCIWCAACWPERLARERLLPTLDLARALRRFERKGRDAGG